MNLKEMLLKESIVKTKGKDEEPFTLASGKKSKLFIDIKEAILNPEILGEIVRIIDFNWDWFSDMNTDIIGSVAIGGVPIASVLSIKREIKQVIVRSEKHERGTETKVIGNCINRKVLLIEDVATTGNSIVNAVISIREARGICDNCIVIVDREDGAKEWCKKNGINLYSLLKKSDFGINEE